MSLENKRAQIYNEFEKLIPLCVNGNKHAEEYLRDINIIVRTIDDIADKDVDVSVQQIQYIFFALCFKLFLNPFYQANIGMLLGVQMAAYNAWLDSDRLKESSNEVEKKWGSVIRGYIDEILPMAAYLTGGFDAMRKVSLKLLELETFYRG